MKVACIILNYNDVENTINLINEIKSYTALNDIIVVDNCSTDNSLEMLKEYENEKIHIYKTQQNGGYGLGNNYGVACAKRYNCEYALIANPDVHFDNKLVLDFMCYLKNNSEYAIVSGIQLDRNNEEIKRSAWKIPTIWRYIFSTGSLLRSFGENFYYTKKEMHSGEIINVDCVAGSLLMVDVSKFLACGGYDEEMFLYCEETALGIKMKESSYKTAILAKTAYRHIHGASIQKSVTSNLKRKKLLLQSHHFVLKKYLRANWFQLISDQIIGKIIILEELLKMIIRTK